MKMEFLEEARFELDEAVDFYNQELPGLGKRILQEVLNAIERIAQFPNARHPLSANTRRCQTRAFPYGLIYSELENRILIIAVSNLHRNPTHWQDRVK